MTATLREKEEDINLAKLLATISHMNLIKSRGLDLTRACLNEGRIIGIA